MKKIVAWIKSKKAYVHVYKNKGVRPVVVIPCWLPFFTKIANAERIKKDTNGIKLFHFEVYR